MKMVKEGFQYSEEHIRLARIAKALSHPARLHILNFLNQCEMCYTGNIVDELPIAQSSVSQHLKELKEAGLIQGTIETPKIYYCINKKNWELARSLFKDFF
jgi:DNA-binding transcriptional ArsR family regulator